MEIKGSQVLPQRLVQDTGVQKKSPRGNKTEANFQDVLLRQLEAARQIKISAHARRRMQERNITLNQQDWGKINNAISKAEAKGANNSLLIHGELALIVSVKNRTVISAVDEEAMKEHVFTNIDSAVIIR